MKLQQVKNAGLLFVGQFFIRIANFAKQLILAFFLGVSANIDLLLAAQIVPSILSSMIGGGAGEVLVTTIRKKAEDNARLVVLFTFCISTITVIVGSIYLLSVPAWIKVFKISNEVQHLFWILSIIVVADKIPLALVATFKNLLYYKNLYRYYIITTLISEIIGIGTILLLVKTYGIIAFAIGGIVTSTVNSILFFNIHGLTLRFLFRVKDWVDEKYELIGLFKRVFSLSLQTLVNHLSTFWERTLSMRYLTPGYLSALNYSKSLSEMPQSIMLSSILTTTYVEQARIRNDNEKAFVGYTKRMEGILSKLTASFQVLSVIFAPLILILFFRRGKFDNEAVEFTLIIYQILTVGFLFGVMISFFSRTMFILNKFRQLLVIVIFKFIIVASTMSLLISRVPHAIPIAIVLGQIFHSVTLFFYINKTVPGIFNQTRFVLLYTLVLMFTIIILYLNQLLIPFILSKTLIEVIVLYIPVVLVCGVLFLWYINKLGYLKPIVIKIKSVLNGKRT